MPEVEDAAKAARARARARGARTLTAEEFLSRLERPRSSPSSEKPSPDAEDVERWLEEFRKEDS